MPRLAASNWTAIVLLVAAGALGFIAGRPPTVVPDDAPAAEFSAARAVPDLRVIAAAPHPVGTMQHDRVRDYIVDRLRTLGCDDVHVQSATGFNTLEGPLAATIANIVCRIPGRTTTPTILLTAHYDGVPRAPAAGDDGAGVAAILETLRAIRAGPPLERDLIVVISDAEEAGLLGAEAFVDLHPWARDVAVVLNFDNRGDRGPVYMFQTSAGNAPLIDMLARGVRVVRANSLAADIYRLLPSDTDLSIWLHSAYPVGAFNFAVIDGYTHYHTPIDDLASLDLRVVQQMGNYAMGLVRSLETSRMLPARDGDDIYFNAPLLGLVHYPIGWALPLAAGAFVLAVIVIVAAGRRGRITRIGMTRGGVALILGVAVPVLLAVVLWQLIAWLHPAFGEIEQGDPYNSLWYFTMVALIAGALAVEIERRFSRIAGAVELAVAPLALWAILDVIVASVLPGGSYLFTWPLIAATAAVAWWVVTPPLRRPSPLVALLAAPALVLWLPLIASLEVGMTMRLLPFCVLLLMLVAALLGPIIEVIGSLRRPAAMVLAALALAALVIAESRAGFTVRRKRPDSLAYLVDEQAGRAWWFSLDRAPDSWTTAALGSSPERRTLAEYGVSDRRMALVAPAPVDSFPSPVRVMTVDSTAAGARVHLGIARSGSGEEIDVVLPDADSAFDMTINGRTLPDGASDRYTSQYHSGPGGMVVRYFGVPEDGVDLRFTVRGPAPPVLRIRARWEGLPPTPRGPLASRPATFMSKPFVPTDVTIAQWEAGP